MVIEQYPHSITVTKVPDYEQGVDGNFSTDGEATTFVSSCRVEPAGDNPVIKGVDGSDIVFRWIVYMPRTEEELDFGSPVMITLKNGSQYQGTLKRQYNGQLNSRLWV